MLLGEGLLGAGGSAARALVVVLLLLLLGLAGVGLGPVEQKGQKVINTSSVKSEMATARVERSEVHNRT